MKIGTWKLRGALFLAVNLALSLHLHAQTTFTVPFEATQSSPAITFNIDSYGTLSETGTLTSATFSFTSGTPTMLWFPAFAAFRAGAFNGSQTTIGEYSVAFGGGSVASGEFSVAAGDISTASGEYSVAMGLDATALGTGSTSIGFANYAGAAGATALGSGNDAGGSYSTAFGYDNYAPGNISTAAGTQATATSYLSFVIGTANAGTPEGGGTASATSWVATDPLFEVGNGTIGSPFPWSMALADAFVVYKNGDAHAQGVLSTHATMRCNPGGDLSMGSYTAGTAP